MRARSTWRQRSPSSCLLPSEGAAAPSAMRWLSGAALFARLLGRQRQPIPVQQSQRALRRLQLLRIGVEPVLLDQGDEGAAASAEIDVGIVDGRRHLLLV